MRGLPVDSVNGENPIMPNKPISRHSLRCASFARLMGDVSPHERRCIEDLNAIGESLVELPEPKPKKKKNL
jgi:hypothetical protein